MDEKQVVSIGVFLFKWHTSVGEMPFNKQKVPPFFANATQSKVHITVDIDGLISTAWRDGRSLHLACVLYPSNKLKP